MKNAKLAKTKKVDGPLKWFGGKHYLADRIIQLFPKHTHYVEPYAGGLAVLLAKDPLNVSEVVNDLNGELINFWRVLADPSLFEDMVRILQATPCCEGVYDQATLDTVKRRERLGDHIPENMLRVTRAVDFFVTCRQSRSALFQNFATLAKTRTRRQMNELPSAWWSAIDGLAEVHARLSRVVILNRPAVECIRSQDGEQTLFYCDAPYVHATRESKNAYAHEMTDDEHREFIDCLLSIKGKAVVSMYPHPIYEILSSKYGWKQIQFDLPNNSSGSKTKRRMVECVWMNYRP